MEMKRRGLSEVVTTVLIILLVLVAIGIIWAAVRPTIENSGSRISGDCLTIQMETLNCSVGPSNTFNVLVKRNVGTGDLQAVKLIFSDTDSSQVVEKPTTIGELESVTLASGTLTGISGTVDVKIAPVVGLTGGSTQTCTEETSTVRCV